MAICSSDLLHSTVHCPTKFQAVFWNLQWVRTLTSFRTDRRTTERSDGRMKRQQYLSATRGPGIQINATLCCDIDVFFFKWIDGYLQKQAIVSDSHDNELNRVYIIRNGGQDKNSPSLTNSLSSVLHPWISFWLTLKCWMLCCNVMSEALHTWLIITNLRNNVGLPYMFACSGFSSFHRNICYQQLIFRNSSRYWPWWKRKLIN